MPDGETNTTAVAPSPAPMVRSPQETRRRWFELALVVLVAFAEPLLTSFNIFHRSGGPFPQIQSLRWIAGIVQEVTALLLLGYILARRNLGFASLGLCWSFGSVGAGVGVALVSYVAYALGFDVLHYLAQAFFPSAPAGPSSGQIYAHPPLAAIPYFFLNPFFEELTVRAYLMSEIADLTGSWMLAAAVSVLLQTSHHLYYGWVGALSLGFQFAVFALYYAFTRKAAPIVVAHGIFDLWGLIRLW